MSEYNPVSRRPIADLFRRTAALAVRLCVAWNIHPDVVSYGSVVASAGASVCFWQASWSPWLLIAGPAFCYVRLWCNMLDGMVALASGKASLKGEIVNELPDRVSDVLIFVGVAHSGLCSPWSGYWSAIAALFVAYVGTLGQAVTGHREFGGVMSKPWRMVLLHVGAWLTLADQWWGDGQFSVGPLTWLDWTCVLILAGSLQTVLVRLRRMVGRLSGPK